MKASTEGVIVSQWWLEGYSWFGLCTAKLRVVSRSRDWTYPARLFSGGIAANTPSFPLTT